jgi:hypothetical protein
MLLFPFHGSEHFTFLAAFSRLTIGSLRSTLHFADAAGVPRMDIRDSTFREEPALALNVANLSDSMVQFTRGRSNFLFFQWFRGANIPDSTWSLTLSAGACSRARLCASALVRERESRSTAWPRTSSRMSVSGAH